MFSYLSMLIVADGFRSAATGGKGKAALYWNQKHQGGSFPGAEGRTGNEAARVNRRSAFLLKYFTKDFPGRGKQRKKFEKGEAIP